MRRRTLATLAALALSAIGVIAAHAFDRSALALVLTACRASWQYVSSPLPCLKVEAPSADLSAYAVLREPLQKQRTILAPLADISGIEDRRLLRSGAPDFFALAWGERRWVLGDTADEPIPDGFALAMNPEKARSQDRLHVHIACLSPKVQTPLAQRIASISPQRFTDLGIRLRGRVIWAMRMDTDDAASFNPLDLLASRMPGADAAMGSHYLIATKQRLPDGRSTFVLLTNFVPPGARHFYSVESLLDPSCSRL